MDPCYLPGIDGYDDDCTERAPGNCHSTFVYCVTSKLSHGYALEILAGVNYILVVVFLISNIDNPHFSSL